MKLIRLLAAVALAMTATTAMAQGGPPGGGQGGGGQRQTEMMMKGITLSDAQKATVDSIVAAARAVTMKMREEAQAAGGPPSPELREKVMAVTTKRNEAIKAVLTAEQQAVFAKNLEEIAAMPRQRPPR